MGIRSIALVGAIYGLLAAVALGQEGWRSGRGTFYGDEPWLWDIHKGSCGYGQLDPNKGTGWDIAALPDMHYEFGNHGDSCGRCYEVKCDPQVFTDNYNNQLDRSSACYDPEQSFIVTITDTCPCEFPDNYYSNKRWCCGDMDHLDLSVYTFDKMAERRWGVIAIKYRPVACPQGPAGPYSVVSNGEGSRLDWLKNALLRNSGSEGSVQAFSGEGLDWLGNALVSNAGGEGNVQAFSGEG